MREAELLRLLAHDDRPEERERRDDGVEERRAEVGGKRSGQPPESARHNERDPVDVKVDAVRREDQFKLRLEAARPARANKVERLDDLRQVAKARFQHAAGFGAERAEVEGAGLAHLTLRPTGETSERRRSCYSHCFTPRISHLVDADDEMPSSPGSTSEASPAYRFRLVPALRTE